MQMNQNFFAEVVNMADLLNFFEDQREQQKRQLQYQTQNEPSELEKLQEELEVSKLKFVSGFRELIK